MQRRVECAIKKNNRSMQNGGEQKETGKISGDKVARILVYGQEMLEKKVALSYNCGRIYLPYTWIGKKD